MNVNKLFAGTILILVLVVGGLIFLLQIPEKFNILRPKPTSVPKTQTNVLTTDTQKIKEELTKTDKKIGDLHLEENDKFEIDYLISNDQFSIQIKEDPFAENKKEAEQWFLNEGFKQTDLCLFRIFFWRSDSVTQPLSAADTVPTGCDEPAIDGLAPSKPTQ